MLNRKKDRDQKKDEQDELVRQIDAMMDPKRPEGADSPPASDEKEAAPVPTDVPSSSSAKTAPQLSDKLRKQLGVSASAASKAKPITIKQLDELTGEIEDSDKPDVPEADAEGTAPVPDTDESDKAETETKPAPDIESGSVELDDARTDEAVDDIVSHEGDVMLAVEDATAAERNRELNEKDKDAGGHHLLSTIFWTLVFVVVIVAVLLAVLFITGGKVAGLHR